MPQCIALQNLWAGEILKYKSPPPRPMFPNFSTGKRVRAIGLPYQEDRMTDFLL